VTSLVSPFAWGLSHDEASWRASVLDECSATYARRLEESRRFELPSRSRENLARAVCSDARMFWRYVQVSQVDAEWREAKLRRADEAEVGPIVIGIHGENVAEVSAATHALRDLLYANSDTILQWTRDRRRVRAWANDRAGGAWAGLVYVQFDDPNRGSQMYKRERVQEAHDYMIENGMSASVLAVSAVGNARPALEGLPVHWAELGDESACAFDL